MLNSTGTHYTVEIPLGIYNRIRRLTQTINDLHATYNAATTDAERITVLRQITTIHSEMLDALITER